MIKNGGKNFKNSTFNNNWSYNYYSISLNSGIILMEVSNKGDNKVKGISLQLDIIYIILFFLLIAVVIIGFMSLFSNRIREGLESGKIWEWIENLFRKGFRG